MHIVAPFSARDERNEIMRTVGCFFLVGKIGVKIEWMDKFTSVIKYSKIVGTT